MKKGVVFGKEVVQDGQTDAGRQFIRKACKKHFVLEYDWTNFAFFIQVTQNQYHPR